jgi:hypothetical protein
MRHLSSLFLGHQKSPERGELFGYAEAEQVAPATPSTTSIQVIIKTSAFFPAPPCRSPHHPPSITPAQGYTVVVLV